MSSVTYVHYQDRMAHEGEAVSYGVERGSKNEMNGDDGSADDISPQ